MDSLAIDAYVVGSDRDGADTPRSLNLRPIPALGAAVSLSLHRETPHHVLDATSGLRTVGRFARANSAPVVATFHDQAGRVTRPPAWLSERLTAAILVSESQRATFRPHFPAERTFVIPYGVDTDRFVPAESPARGARVAVAGSNCNDALLASATERTRTAHPDVVFRRVDGDESSRLAAYQSAAVVLFPLAPVAASRALLEAMAAGAPIVATDVGGVRGYADRAVVLVDPTDPQAMADAVVRLLDDPQVAAELGRRARTRAEQFDLATAAARHRAVYRWCRSTHARPGRA